MTQTFTTGQIAKICHVAQKTVVKWCDSGMLPCRRIPGGNRRLVNESDLAEFLKKHELLELWDRRLVNIQREPTK